MLTPEEKGNLLEYVNIKGSTCLRFHSLYNKLLISTSFLPLGAKTARRLWHIRNDIDVIPICPICKIGPRKWLYTEYQTHCSARCGANNEHTKITRKNSNIKKYGVDNPRKSPTIKQNIQNTWLEKYGVDNPNKHPDVREKISKTCVEKYGVNHSTLIPEKIKKTKETWFKKYGCHPNQQHLINILPLIDDPTWLFDQYITQHKTAVQIAQELNMDSTVLYNRLHSYEIEINTIYKTSFKANQWLEQIEKEHNIKLIREYPVEGSRYKADGYCPETNTIYEFYGDYWHGNPQVFQSDTLNESTNCTMGELYQNTVDREQYILSLGYNIIVCWET